MKKALKYPFLRKGMGINLPSTIVHKEWGLDPLSCSYSEFERERHQPSNYRFFGQN